MVGAAAGPIWIKSPFWIIPYGILAIFMGLLTLPIMLSKYENKLTRKSFYEYVACACCAFLLLLQGNWFAGGLALSATVLGILWRALLTHEHKKYSRTLH
jgi:O-antigen/teichoic acid export membrane protein